jgi:hypothetical protein
VSGELPVCPEHGIHLWILGACRRLSFAGLDDQEIFERVRSLTRNVRRAVTDHEISDAITKVRGTQVSGLYRPAKPKFDPEALAAFAARGPAIDEDYLRKRSPVDPCGIDSDTFLLLVYRPGEQVLIFNDQHSQGQFLWKHRRDSGQRKALERLGRKGAHGIWFLSNPIDGHYHFNPREGKRSRRSEESIIDFRHVVLENDEAPIEHWLSYVVQMPFAVTAIYTSGGRSIHVLARVDQPSKEAWDRYVRVQLLPIIVRYGADPGALTAVRLSRLPGCYRAEKQAWQKLLFLNPEPSPTPIRELEVIR